MVPPENDPIMLGTLIQSFRHLEYQNPSISSDFIDKLVNLVIQGYILPDGVYIYIY